MSDAAAQRRAKQTLNNLLLSLAATVGVMVLLVLAVPRDDSNRVQPVDYVAIAEQAAAETSEKLLVPTIPKSDLGITVMPLTVARMLGAHLIYPSTSTLEVLWKV